MTLTLQNASFPPEPIATVTLPGRERTKLPATLSEGWGYFLTTLLNIVNICPSRQGSAEAHLQNASIAATDLTDGTFGAGLYRLTYYARVTKAAGVSSSLQVTFAWTDHAIAQTSSGAAMTGNTTTTQQSGTVLVYSNAASPISYSTTYASNGAGEMEYSLYVVIERVQA